MIALIPARSGSERISNKNIRDLAGHPLIVYTIAAARESNLFSGIVISTDSVQYAEIVRGYGVEVVMRPEQYARSGSPDIEWLQWTLDEIIAADEAEFAILRPTSPFRSARTIRRCYREWDRDKYDSIRAVEPVSQYPGKMWVLRGGGMTPLMPLQPSGQPWHSSQMKVLPKVYVQNAALEMASVGMVRKTGTIAGTTLQPFITKYWEGFDLNTEYDWEIAEKAIRDGEAVLPKI